MAGVYRPRHPERTVLYRVLFHYFDQFASEYENRFQREYGYFRQVVFVIPKMLRIFFKFRRKLLGELCHAAVQALLHYFQATTGTELIPGVMGVIQTFGERINFLMSTL